MGNGISLVIVFAFIVTVAELLVSYFLIKKYKRGIWQSLYISLPVIVIVWVVALTNS
ncbi:hypothetical protein ACFO3D_15625 [Virgibacillus kekensis]|uniref:Cardiolipin synthase N-terminal domain-containing protein n=1 Tax=Virgibacillus kekensis TaxID=202261 RepID=A0ABV9DLU4_9BACI